MLWDKEKKLERGAQSIGEVGRGGSHRQSPWETLKWKEMEPEKEGKGGLV